VAGDKIGVMGFSMGAAYALLLTSIFRPPAVGAVALFYGNYPDLDVEEFNASQAAFQGHFAESDEWESADDARRTEERLRRAGREATFHFYPGVGHWFFENNRPDAYNAPAAELAWQRTVEFLRGALAGPD
jgi:carboxymethylenebutenolidase